MDQLPPLKRQVPQILAVELKQVERPYERRFSCTRPRSSANEATPRASPTTASPSIRNERVCNAAAAATIAG